MSKTALAIKATGLVTSVGLSAAATCAALRAKVSHAIESVFVDSLAEAIVVHEVPLPIPWRGRYRLIFMAALAVRECLAAQALDSPSVIPIFLCVAELERPGRLEHLDASLLQDICAEAGIQCDSQSEVIALGRIGTAQALSRCRELLSHGTAPLALVVAVDSLLCEETLDSFHRADRLLTRSNSNGFIPGEGAGAVLIGLAGTDPELRCTGLGFATEAAHIESELPLRGEGLAKAARAALAEAGCDMEDIDYRSADLSGEHYYFKEAALLSGRLIRRVVPEIDIWHPAECIGETGALVGLVLMIAAEASSRKGYAPGRRLLAHMACDHGQRAAAVFEYRGPDE